MERKEDIVRQILTGSKADVYIIAKYSNEEPKQIHKRIGKEEINNNRSDKGKNNYRFEIPEQYRDKLFFTADDIQKMLMLGKSKTYEFLKDPPFRVVKVGNQIRVVAASFWNWYTDGMIGCQ